LQQLPRHSKHIEGYSEEVGDVEEKEGEEIMTEAERIFNQVIRLHRFKPKYVRWCLCDGCELKPMRFHHIYRCADCGGKVEPVKKYLKGLN
jgi:hypothetical protein